MMHLFADSGAWSAFKQGNPINLDSYCAWLKENKHLIHHYACLDVIGDGQKSYDNWVEMRKRGFDPLPVYHASTSIKFLEKYLAAGTKYMCLGAIARMNTSYRISNLDLIWANHLVDKHGMPLLKVHGFGLTSLRIMTRYPWYSVDSTSWAYAARCGLLFIPRYNKGGFRYVEQSYKRFVSTRSPTKNGGERHIDSCSPQEKQLLQAYLTSNGIPYGKSTFRVHKPGETLAENERLWNKRVHIGDGRPLVETVVELGICNDQKVRNEANIKFFLNLAKELPPWPWPFKSHTLHKRVYV